MSMSTRKLAISIALLVVSATASAETVDPGLMKKLHSASIIIKQHTNDYAVIESIYKQVRPRANVTKTTLSVAEIDRIVRSYVSKKYAPALVTNYMQLYSQLKAAKADFAACDAPQPFNLTRDVLAALCVKAQGSAVRVEYRTNGYDRGWLTTAVYTFAAEGNVLKLNEIELLIKEGVKAHVEGL